MPFTESDCGSKWAIQRNDMWYNEKYIKVSMLTTVGLKFIFQTDRHFRCVLSIWHHTWLWYHKNDICMWVLRVFHLPWSYWSPLAFGSARSTQVPLSWREAAQSLYWSVDPTCMKSVIVHMISPDREMVWSWHLR